MVRLGSMRWRKMVLEGAGQVGVGLFAEQIEPLTYHCKNLLKWNRTINLTAITDPVEIAVKHLIDSLSIIPYIAENKNILDVGSGGGFPGIPLAVARPDLDVTLIDAVAKKVSFLKATIRGLALPNCQAHHIRIEPFPQNTRRDSSGALGRFHTIVSRAVADPEICLRLAIPHLAPGGSILMMRGRTEKESAQSLEALCKELLPQYKTDIAVHPTRLPFLNDIRHIVVVKTFARRLGSSAIDNRPPP